MVEESGTLESQLEATKVRTILIKDCENKTFILYRIRRCSAEKNLCVISRDKLTCSMHADIKRIQMFALRVPLSSHVHLLH